MFSSYGYTHFRKPPNEKIIKNQTLNLTKRESVLTSDSKPSTNPLFHQDGTCSSPFHTPNHSRKFNSCELPGTSSRKIQDKSSPQVHRIFSYLMLLVCTPSAWLQCFPTIQLQCKLQAQWALMFGLPKQSLNDQHHMSQATWLQGTPQQKLTKVDLLHTLTNDIKSLFESVKFHLCTCSFDLHT